MGSFSSISPAPVFSRTNVSFAPGRSWHGSLGVKPPLIVGRPGINRSVQEVEERSWAPKRRRVKSITAAVKMYLQLDLEESITRSNDAVPQSRNKMFKGMDGAQGRMNFRPRKPMDAADISSRGDARPWPSRTQCGRCGAYRAQKEMQSMHASGGTTLMISDSMNVEVQSS